MATWDLIITFTLFAYLPKRSVGVFAGLVWTSQMGGKEENKLQFSLTNSVLLEKWLVSELRVPLLFLYILLLCASSILLGHEMLKLLP